MAEISRIWYKIAIICVKYIPILISICYFIGNICTCFGIALLIISNISHMSLLPIICVLSFSFLLKYCIWHRLPIYYAMLIDVVNWIDYYIHIPVNSAIMLSIYLTITIIFILVGMYLKNKDNKTKN